MIEIQCQSCTKVYLVPSSKIGKSGRNVQCTSCNFIWHVNPKKKRFSYIFFTVLASIIISFITINPDKVQKPYKNLMHKLAIKKEGQNINVSEFYKDCLLLSNIDPNHFKSVKEECFN